MNSNTSFFVFFPRANCEIVGVRHLAPLDPPSRHRIEGLPHWAPTVADKPSDVVQSNVEFESLLLECVEAASSLVMLLEDEDLVPALGEEGCDSQCSKP